MGASAPASEKWPSGTLMQSAALSWYQASSCAGRYCPASHGLQPADPLEEAHLPPGQMSHEKSRVKPAAVNRPL